MPRAKKTKPEEEKRETKSKSAKSAQGASGGKAKTQEVEAVKPAGEKPEKKVQEVKKPEQGFFFGTGRRKTATARARLYLPTSDVTIAGKKLERGDTYVNAIPIETYFSDPLSKAIYTEIYRTTNTIGRFITTVITSGSGKSGQLGATTLAISRALCTVDPRFQPILRKRGFLTRDSRMKERKKPGLMGARKQKSSPKR